MRCALALTVVALFACRRDSARDHAMPPNASAEPTIPPLPPEFPEASAEQLTRKAKSEARLLREGIPINGHLPVIADEAHAKIRTKDVVVDRAIALLIVSVKGEGLEQSLVDTIRAKYSADPLFSPKEKAFVIDAAPTALERAQFAWRYEDLGVIHWALGYVSTLRPPSEIVDAGTMVRLVKEVGATKYRDGAKLRTAAEILDEADLIYRYDWACVDARVKGKPPPTGIDCEIVVERHRALNWLYGYQGQAWDDVSTDT